MPNDAQIESWDGPGGEHWVAEAARYDRMNERFGERIVEAAAPSAGERFLDVGCGNGAVALAIADLVGPEGSVTGLDISGPMLANARRRADAAGLGNVTFEKGDAQVAPIPDQSFDAVVSRFGVMFFDDPTEAFRNLQRALKPGGRVAFTCWQELFKNEWIVVPAVAALQHVPMPDLGEAGAPGPFAFADADRLRTLLADAGWADVALEEVVRPMAIAESLDDALHFLRNSDIGNTLVKGVDGETAERAWAAVRDALAAHEGADGVVLNGTAWLVTARRGG
ncbi:MAG TPA: methyltransferase domain-containing protein [Acidimicrobiales bacterium]